MFALGVCIAGLAAIIAFLSPGTFFPGGGRLHGGYRLVRDDGEPTYYFHHANWKEVALQSADEGAANEDYPPLGVAYFSWPRLLTDSFGTFQKIFVAQNVVAFGLLFALTARLLSEERRPKAMLLLMVMPDFLYFTLWRFDIFPALLVTGAFVAAHRRDAASALFLLFLATITKWYAFLLLPGFFMYFGAMRGEDVGRRLRHMLPYFLGIGALSTLGYASFFGLGGLIEPVLFHLQRNIQFASMLKPILFSFNLLGPESESMRLVLGRVALLCQFLAPIPLVLWGRVRDFRSLVRASVFVLIPFIAVGPVFSQQWILWLTPLLLPVATKKEALLLAALDIVLYLQFPVAFDHHPFSVLMDALTVVRTVMFAALWWMSVRELWPRNAAHMPVSGQTKADGTLPCPAQGHGQ